jgi:hypothetical protein
VTRWAHGIANKRNVVQYFNAFRNATAHRAPPEGDGYDRQQPCLS